MPISPNITAICPSCSVSWTAGIGGSLSWTATAGTPTSGSGSPFIWGAPASGVVRISVTNGSLTEIRDVQVVTFTFFQDPSIVVEGSMDDITVLHQMENGSRAGRRKSKAKRRWELTFRSRTVSEYDTAVALFNNVGKLEPFLMLDPITQLNTAYYFDSGISVKYGGRSCDVTYAFRILEA